MKTVIKRLFSNIQRNVQRYSLCSVLMVLVLAVVADRAISRGMNVSLSVASLVELSASVPTAGDSKSSSQVPAPALKDAR